MKIKREMSRLYKMNLEIHDFVFKVQELVFNILFLCKNYKNIEFVKPADQIKKEYLQELKKLNELIMKKRHGLKYPDNWAVSKTTGFVLYTLIRTLKPRTILETGVANGYSTRLILSALNRNKIGRLISVDVNKNVGGLLEGIDKTRWGLYVGKPRKNLKDAIKKINKIDVFIHDSDHSYENMTFEFNIVLEKMAGHGIIMSDDISGNEAFLDFARKLNKKPEIFPSIKKAFGVIRL